MLAPSKQTSTTSAFEAAADRAPASPAARISGSTPAVKLRKVKSTPQPPKSRLRRTLVFARSFLRHPLMLGTLFQSSQALVRRLVDGSPWQRCRTVVELGPGVGTITSALLDRMPEDSRLLAIETNPQFVEELDRSLPDPRLIAMLGSAADLRRALRLHGIGRLDGAISGIPFSMMPLAMRRAIVGAVADALSPSGEFVVYQHSALMLPLLRERFEAVLCESEWRNPVPMRIFRCRRPIRTR